MRLIAISLGLALLESLSSTGSASAQSIQWPVAAPRIVQDYACLTCAGLPGFHSGIDIISGVQNCATSSVPVYPALAGGTVYRVYTGCVQGGVTTCGDGFGNHVIIEHRGAGNPAGPLFSVYGHLSTVMVHVGDQPTLDTQLGIMGATGYVVGGCHLHLGFLNFDPLSGGAFTEANNTPINFDGYPSAFPSTNCDLANKGHGCLDPKSLLALTTQSVSAPINALASPGQSEQCITPLDAGETYASIAQYNLNGQLWQYVALPSANGPKTNQGGTSNCTSNGLYGWLPSSPSSASGQFISIIGSQLQGAGLSVLSSPSLVASSLTDVWGGEVFWSSTYLPAGGGCSQPWYQISLPAARAGGATSGWICGDDVTVAGVGNINVSVTQGGTPWPGQVSYELEGPQTLFGYAAQSFTGVEPGGYSIQYLGGGPGGLPPSYIPPASQLLGTGQTISWTLAFSDECSEVATRRKAATTSGASCSGASLFVTMAGTGSGSVTSNPSGIDCPGTCATIFTPLGTQVTLSSNPSLGSTFAGWSGDPACANSITMNGDYACTATFTATASAYTVTVSDTGAGTVTSSDGAINCGSACSQTYLAGTTVTLAASAASGWSFVSWSGGCSGGPVYQAPLTSNLSCIANFIQNTQPSPQTTTVGVTNPVGATSATLNGTINPEGFSAIAYFQYGPEPNLLYATPPIAYGPANYMFFPFSQTITGLACATNYQFRAVGVGAGGDYIASNAYFTTASCPPAPCYPLFLVGSDGAPIPTASPTNSSGCPVGQYHAGDQIALSVPQVAGDVIVGWTGTNNNASTASTNTATMTAPTLTAQALFQHVCYLLSLGFTGQGSAPVATNAVAGCPPGYFPWGYEVDLSGASPAIGWQIGGWGGTEDDSSLDAENDVLMPTKNQTVLVQYVPIEDQLSVTTIGDGAGTVVSSSPGINCGMNCSASFQYGTTVNLIATPAQGSIFLSWSGPSACTGGAPITSATTCTAEFGLSPPGFYTLTPCRVLDTRNSTDPNGPAINAVEYRLPVLAGICGIPTTAKALSVNVTIVNPTAAGFLSLYPALGVSPSVSTINFSPGQVLANNAVISLNSYGGITVYCGMASGQVDYVIDVNGYFQ